MSKVKCPYSFPARSRQAMIDYILKDRRAYGDWHDSFLFNWNVKAHHVNWQNPKGESPLDPALDDAWNKVSQEEWVYHEAFEDVSSYYSDNLWTSYPGDDQGDWKLEFHGRQGGHLCLVSWRGTDLRDMDSDDMRAWLEGLDNANLRKFYIGIVCADSDFTSRNASENVEYALNNIRAQWEEEQHEIQEEERIAFAESYADSRPDLYAGHY